MQRDSQRPERSVPPKQSVPPEQSVPYVIVVGSEKGGTGKSTTAIHLAVALMKLGFRVGTIDLDARQRSEEHTSELQSLMRISYAVFCLKKKNNIQQHISIDI